MASCLPSKQVNQGEYLGDTVVMGNDTLIIIDYSPKQGVFILNNGKTVAEKIILNY